MVLETRRLQLREMEANDFASLCGILQDPEVMYAYEHAFGDEEVRQWLERQRKRYRKDGFGLWAVVERPTGELVGQCGLTMQQWGERMIPEIGYLLRKDRWHMGYATEAALACRDFGFSSLGLPALYSIIRENNLPSQAVARRCGMSLVGRQMKHYYQMDMPHLVFCVENPEKSEKTGGQTL